MSQAIRMAIQKSGRLSEQSLGLLTDCDFRFPSTKDKRAIRYHATNFPLEILSVRDDDIPQYVSDKVVDLGIVGENVIQESEYSLQIIEKLDFGYCRLALAVPNGSNISSLRDLEGRKIATSYPRITSHFLESQKIKADIHFISGSVEVAPSLGIADAICDLVGTGSTLIQNGLKELATVLHSQAVLVCSRDFVPSSDEICSRLLFRIRSVEKARNLKYLMLNCKRESLQKVTTLIKGTTSPTVLELADKDWLAVHAVVSGSEIWDLIEQLKAIGAEGILVSQVEKMIS